jgi:hypothetical protein
MTAEGGVGRCQSAKIKKAGNLELVAPISRGLVQDKPCLLWLTSDPGFKFQSLSRYSSPFSCNRSSDLFIV